MVSKELTYENFDGEMVTEKAYFNLTRMELMKMDAVLPGGLMKYAEKIQKERDPNELVKFLDLVVLASYGTKTAEGKFVKPKDNTDAFAVSEAYSALIEDLMAKDGAIEDFVTGIMPKVPTDHQKTNAAPGKAPIPFKPNEFQTKVVEVNAVETETEEERIERLVQERLKVEREQLNAASKPGI